MAVLPAAVVHHTAPSLAVAVSLYDSTGGAPNTASGAKVWFVATHTKDGSEQLWSTQVCIYVGFITP